MGWRDAAVRRAWLRADGDESGQVVTASLTLSAFGQTVASSGSSTSAYQFGATSGYGTEGDAGLTLVGCRYYDAQVGQFITRDTYLDQKPYAYCDGDPVNATGPSGHFSKQFWWAVAVVALGITAEVVDNFENPSPPESVAAPIQLKVPGRGGGPDVPTGVSVGGGPPPPNGDPPPTTVGSGAGGSGATEAGSGGEYGVYSPGGGIGMPVGGGDGELSETE